MTQFTIRGHDLLAVERFRDDTRHMIEFEVLKDDNLIALRGETARLFLNERGYQRALQSQELGENHISVRLSGKNMPDGYAVYKIREIAFGGGTKLSAEDGFLQFMIERLLASDAPEEIAEDEDEEEAGDDMKLTSLQSITDFMACVGRTMPDNIRLWARRNLAVARSHEVSPYERRHA